MALAGEEIAFWGLVALWMSLAFLAWGLAFGATGRKAGPTGINRGRLKAVMGIGYVILGISIVLFLPFFIPSLEILPASYITVTNASVALFVAVGILMVSRTKAPPVISRDAALGRIPAAIDDDDDMAPVEVISEEPDGALEGPGAPSGAIGAGKRAELGGPGEAPALGPGPSSQSIDCPQCSRSFEVTIRSLPAAIKCPHCGVEGELEA